MGFQVKEEEEVLIEQVSLESELTGEAQVAKHPRELGLLSSGGLVAAQGFPEGVRPGQLALEELMFQQAEQQRPDCFHHSLGWTDEWQMVLDGRVP